MAGTLVPVERENLVARGIAQFLRPTFEQRRGDHFACFGEVIHEVRRPKHTEFLDERCEPATIDDHGDTVMFAPGEPFYGTPGKGKNEIRIAYVLKQADLERAMDLLAKGIAAYNAR